MSEEMKRFELTLIDNEQVGVDYFIFNFEMPKGLIYKEGQYGAFKHVDKEIEGRKVRALTLASKCDDEVLKIATVITDSPSDFKAKMLDLKKGDKIAVVKNAFGQVLKEYFAPEDGIVIGKSSNPANMSGGRIIHLGILEY